MDLRTSPTRERFLLGVAALVLVLVVVNLARRQWLGAVAMSVVLTSLALPAVMEQPRRRGGIELALMGLVLAGMVAWIALAIVEVT